MPPRGVTAMTTAQSLAPDTVPQLNPLYLLRWEETQLAYVLLYPEGMVKLNGPAGQILNLVNGTSTVQDIVDELVGEYGDPMIADDICAFLETAYAKRWIRNIA